MTSHIPSDLRTTSQKFMHAHEIMDLAITQEAYTIVSVYAEAISYYLAVLERDARHSMYHDEYVEYGILDD